MKNNKYIVTFTNGKTVFCSCINENDAKILAQAVMIKHGFTKTVATVRMVFGNSEMKIADYVA